MKEFCAFRVLSFEKEWEEIKITISSGLVLLYPSWMTMEDNLNVDYQKSSTHI